jgi:hypothetical protein
MFESMMDLNTPTRDFPARFLAMPARNGRSANDRGVEQEQFAQGLLISPLHSQSRPPHRH